jgi:hypothetical protein
MPPSDSVLVSFLFGGGLLLAAMLFSKRHVSVGGGATWADGRPAVRTKATRRRTWIVGLLIGLGLLIPLGDLWLTWHRDPRWFAIYVLVVLAASLWLLGLGVCEALFVLASASRRDRSRVE